MRIQKEEYVPIADALLNSLSRDIALFEAENHLYNASYLAAMRTAADNVRAKESSDAVLTQQKIATSELYALGSQLIKPMKLLNLVLDKAGIKTPLASDALKNYKKRNFEGVLMNLKSLKSIVDTYSTVLMSKGMKAGTGDMLQDYFDSITAKSNEQTAFQQQRKTFTSENKDAYKQLYTYISDVARLGKIIFQNEEKASEYTIDHLIALVNRNGSKGSKAEETKANNQK